MNRNTLFLRPSLLGSDGQIPVATIAGIRLVYASVLLFGTLGDHEDPGFGWRLKLDDVFATVYLVPAVVAMILAIRNPFQDFRFFPAVLAFDIASIVVLMTTIERPETGFLGFIVAAIAIVLMEVSFRWNIKAARLVANLFALATLFQFALLAAITHTGALPVGVLARRYVILFSILGAVLWALRSMRRIHVIAWKAPDAAQITNLQGMAFHYAASCMGARGGTLCWTLAGERNCKAPVFSLCDAGDAQSETTRVCTAPRDLIDYAAALVDLPSQRALVLRQDDSIRYTGLEGIDTSALQGSGHSSGILIRLAGGSGHGKLVLSGFSWQGWHRLRIGAALGAEIVRVLDHAALKAATLELETGRVRESIARDLHDSVAQSLAGTRYRLSSLRALQDMQTLAAELDEIDANLATEQQQVRQIIEVLRSGGKFSGQSQAIAQLRRLSAVLARQWQVEVEVGTASADFQLGSGLVLELTQMVREAVSNAVRHGGASRVSVALDHIGQGGFELRIRDNGRGFAKAVLAPPHSLMERASALGGTVMHSREHDETIVAVAVPSGTDR